MDPRTLLTATDAEPATPDVDRRSFELQRLKTYRQVARASLQTIADPDVPATWEALRTGHPALDAVPPEAWTQAQSDDEAADDEALAQTVFQARAAAAAAVEVAEATLRTRAGVKAQVQRVGGLVLATLVAVTVVVLAVRWTTPTDLAQGKPWKASSSWGVCEPARGRCGPLVSRILFHTQDDDSPWFQIDLEQPTKFSGVTVVNRRDGDHRDRAVPLVLEVGDSGATWREVARKTDVFSTWKAKFDQQTARYVRLRVARKSWLHLETVTVHP